MLPLPTDPNFPPALKEARLKAGLSRRELADRAGINVAMVGRYEEPETETFSKPSTPTWRKLNEALGFSNPAQPPAITVPEVVDINTATFAQFIEVARKRFGGIVAVSFPQQSP